VRCEDVTERSEVSRRGDDVKTAVLSVGRVEK
jgi:hypothetical protein